MVISGLCLLLALLCSAAAADAEEKVIFIKGAALRGGTNGMYFNEDNELLVAQVLGRAISKISPDSGEILEELGPEDSVLFPDDLTIGMDGTIYWTEIFGGTLFKKSPNASSLPLYGFGTYPWANPVTLSDDGTRLFFAQCFNFEGPNGVYQLDLETNETTPILQDIPLCASNAMDFHEEALYCPRPFEGSVVKIDLANGNAVTNVTTGLGYPIAVKFDSQKRLHVVDGIPGQVFRIDLDDADVTGTNRQVVAQLPWQSADNLAFDKDDRLYVSSFARGSVLEMERDGSAASRVVSPGGVSVAAGLAVLNDVLHVVGLLAMFSYDVNSGEELSVVEAYPGDSTFPPQPINVRTWNENLVTLSFTTNRVAVWDPSRKSVVAVADFTTPIDALPFRDGLLVTEQETGNILFVTGSDLSNREVMANMPGPIFLAGNADTVYATSPLMDTVMKIISDNVVLDTPQQVSSGHDAPEGMVLLDNETLLVVAAGSGTLEKVDISSGEVTQVATDLEFLPPLPESGLLFGWPNVVAVHGDYAFVNGDAANEIYKIRAKEEEGEEQTPPPDSESSADYTSGKPAILGLLAYLVVVVIAPAAYAFS